MKKYKLIKEFPGSPVIGAVAESTKSGNDYNYLIEGKRFGTLCYRYSKRTVEDMPEFWEEIKERNFEILEFKCEMSKETLIRINSEFFTYSKNSEIFREDEICNPHFMISKVRRLSDGEQFAIGDMIVVMDSHDERASEINEIRKNKEDNIVLVTLMWRNNGISINKAKTVRREPILIIEDGINVYEGDTYFTVFSKGTDGIHPFTVYGPHIMKASYNEEDCWDKDCKFFSTALKAQVWIEENKPKPLFRTEDGVDIFLGDECWYALNRNSFEGDTTLKKRKCNGTAKFGKYFFHEENALRYLGTYKVYGVNGSFTKTSLTLANKIKQDYAAGDWKWFDSEEQRASYIEENAPKYSKKDMLDFGKYVGGRLEFTTPLTMFKDWSERLKSK